jgi:hypothetical protein
VGPSVAVCRGSTDAGAGCGSCGRRRPLAGVQGACGRASVCASTAPAASTAPRHGCEARDQPWGPRSKGPSMRRKPTHSWPASRRENTWNTCQLAAYLLHSDMKAAPRQGRRVSESLRAPRIVLADSLTLARANLWSQPATERTPCHSCLRFARAPNADAPPRATDGIYAARRLCQETISECVSRCATKNRARRGRAPRAGHFARADVGHFSRAPKTELSTPDQQEARWTGRCPPRAAFHTTRTRRSQSGPGGACPDGSRTPSFFVGFLRRQPGLARSRLRQRERRAT